MLDITEITNIVVFITIFTTLLGFTRNIVMLRMAVYLNHISYNQVISVTSVNTKIQKVDYTRMIEISVMYVLHLKKLNTFIGKYIFE